MKKILAAALLLCLLQQADAATVDTVSVYSAAMKKAFKCVVIVPQHIGSKAVPSVYLLHGYSGNYSNWIMKVPDLKTYADEYDVLIVCPDGNFSSWYFDSPVDSSMRYETYISKEVPAFIDKKYNTIKDRKARAITGLSMGGHGGLFIGFRHADEFGACGSMSGGVDLSTLHNSFELNKWLGDTVTHAQDWRNSSVMNVVENYPKDSIAIIFDCGTEDFFYKANHNLHEKMLRLRIPHDYIERPGKHDWFYWANAVHYQLLYFRNVFEKNGSVQASKTR